MRGFLRHLSAMDGATEVPAPGLLGPVGHRKPPHVYSDREISDLLQAAAGLAPAGGLRPHCYATLFGLIACMGLRISEALMLTCGDIDLAGGVLTYVACNALAGTPCVADTGELDALEWVPVSEPGSYVPNGFYGPGPPT